MKLELVKVAGSGEVEVKARFQKVSGEVVNLYLDPHETIWIETPHGTIRVAIGEERDSVQLLYQKGVEVGFSKSRAVKLVKE